MGISSPFGVMTHRLRFFSFRVSTCSVVVWRSSPIPKNSGTSSARRKASCTVRRSIVTSAATPME